MIGWLAICVLVCFELLRVCVCLCVDLNARFDVCLFVCFVWLIGWLPGCLFVSVLGCFVCLFACALDGNGLVCLIACCFG